MKPSISKKVSPKEGFCSFCRRTRPAKHFYPSTDRSTGLESTCIDCFPKVQRLARYRKILREQGQEGIARLIEASERKAAELRELLANENIKP